MKNASFSHQIQLQLCELFSITWKTTIKDVNGYNFVVTSLNMEDSNERLMLQFQIDPCVSFPVSFNISYTIPAITSGQACIQFTQFSPRACIYMFRNKSELRVFEQFNKIGYVPIDLEIFPLSYILNNEISVKKEQIQFLDQKPAVVIETQNGDLPIYISDDENDEDIDILSQIIEYKEIKPNPLKNFTDKVDQIEYFPDIDANSNLCGIINLGATCYVNSILQMLFHIPIIRKMVFETSLRDSPHSPIILCLQRLFFQMQEMKIKKCSTTELLSAFGWGSERILLGQDSMEFFNYLMDRMPPCVTSLFSIQLTQYLRCKQLNIVENRSIEINAFPLPVFNIHDVDSSLKEYLSPKQDGDYEKGLTIINLPKILVLHLQRFKCNDKRAWKLNSLFEFSSILDLSKYNMNERSVYHLYSVVMHWGSLNSGHFISFARPDMGNQWYEFNDSRVRKVNEEYAIQHNFGGQNRRYNAYILVYIREQNINEIFCKIPKNCIPEHLKKYTYTEEIEDVKPPPQFTMSDENSLRINALKLKPSFLSIDNKKSIAFPHGTSIDVVYQTVADIWMKCSGKIRIWEVTYGKKLARTLNAITTSTCKIWFIQDINENETIDVPDESITVFIHFYFPGFSNPLQYIGGATAQSNDKISCLFSVIQEKLRFDFSPALISYAIVLNSAQLLENEKTFTEHGLSNGAFLVFQVEPNTPMPSFSFIFYNKEENEEYDVNLYNEIENEDISTIDLYLKLQTSIIKIKVFPYIRASTIPEVTLLIRNSCSSSHLKELIAMTTSHQYEATKDVMLLFRRNDDKDPMKDQDSISKLGLAKDSIFYMILNDTQGEEVLYIKVYYNKRYHTIPIKKSEKVESIVSFLKQSQVIATNKTMFRFLLTYHSKVYDIISEKNIIKLPKYNLKIEDLSEEDMALHDYELFVIVSSGIIDKPNHIKCFDEPYFLKICITDSCHEVKNKIQRKTGVGNNFRLALDDEDMLYDEIRTISEDEIVYDVLNGESKLYAIFNNR